MHSVESITHWKSQSKDTIKHGRGYAVVNLPSLFDIGWNIIWAGQTLLDISFFWKLFYNLGLIAKPSRPNLTQVGPADYYTEDESMCPFWLQTSTGPVQIVPSSVDRRNHLHYRFGKFILLWYIGHIDRYYGLMPTPVNLMEHLCVDLCQQQRDPWEKPNTTHTNKQTPTHTIHTRITMGGNTLRHFPVILMPYLFINNNIWNLYLNKRTNTHTFVPRCQIPCAKLFNAVLRKEGEGQHKDSNLVFLITNEEGN